MAGRIKALLLDLDDTLLVNDADRFLSTYYRALVARMQGVVPVGRFADALGAGTRAMERNAGENGTNAEAFARAFFPRVGRTPAELMPLFDDFYAHEFQALAALTSVDPHARELLKWARDRGLQLAVATQPVFPRAAILSRLRWADVPDEEFAYDYISSYEDLSACKPHRVFFATVLERLGRRPDECLMVGDSPEADMPARACGLYTYWVDRGKYGDPDAVPCDARGDLRRLITLLETGGIEDARKR